MTNFTKTQIEEINTIIGKITEAIKPDSEIGARDRKSLASLLSASKIDKSPKFFSCKREYSETIVSYFNKEKNLPKNKFSIAAQSFIFLI